MSKTVDCDSIIELNVDSYLFLEKDSLKLKIIIKNKTNDNMYFLLSQWEIDGLINKNDFFIGFPNDSYMVNRIHFFPKTMNINQKIRYVGEKGEYPIHDKFPSILILKPNESQELLIYLSKAIPDSIDISNYRFNCQLCYTYDNEWDALRDKIGDRINQALIHPTKNPLTFVISEFRKIHTYNESPYSITLYGSDYLHKIFDNFIVSKCNKKVDW